MDAFPTGVARGLLAALNVAVLVPATLCGQSRKLNAPFTARAGDVKEFRITSDGTRVVYRADQETNLVKELYSVPLDASAPALALTPGVDTLAFELDPGGAHAVYTSEQATSGVIELYSVPLDASTAPVKLNAALVAGGDVLLASGSFAISPDGARVVYGADQDSDELYELYSVPLDASAAPVKLSGPMAAGGDLLSFQISPGGTAVVYRADQDTDGRSELYSVPIDGAIAPLKLNAPLAPGRNVTAFAIGPSGFRVVYTGDQDTDEMFELYSVPIDASASPVKLSGPMIAAGDVLATGFAINPAGTRVVYRADQQTNGLIELYSVPINASAAPVKLSGALVAGGAVESFAFSSAGTRVVYLAYTDASGILGLYSVPISGSAAPTQLNTPFSDPADAVLADFQISADSNHVVYRFLDEDAGGQTTTRLYRVPIAGGAPPFELNAPLAPFRDVSAFRLAPDGARVLYAADHERELFFDLYGVPLDASAAPVKLSGYVFRTAGAPAAFQIAPDSARVLYLADQDLPGPIELFAAPLDASAPSAVLNPPITSAGPIVSDVWDFAASPDGRWVVYLADQDIDNQNELYTLPRNGSAAPVRLSPFPELALHVSRFVISSDSARVVFRAGPDPDGPFQLYSVPIDAGADPVLVSTHPPGGSIESFPSFQLTSDAARVVYVLELGALSELYSAPLDAGAAPTKLSGAFPTEHVSSFQLAPGDARVVFTTSPGFTTDLYSVLLDASAAPVRLNPPLAGLESVGNYSISPDGNRVVYRADQDIDDVFELYSVPTDGSASPLKLNPTLSGNRDVEFWFRISPDGARVVYLSDQDVDNAIELFSVPIDDSAPPVQLNPPMGANALIRSDFAITADGQRVVYTSEPSPIARFELYSVPIDASAPASKISRPLVSGGSVQAFELSSDGMRAVYLSDAEVNDELELYSAPVEGGASIELSGPLVAGGDVSGQVGAFQISPDGRWVAYRADQDADEVVELYGVPLDGSAAPERLNSALTNGGDVASLPTFQFSADSSRVLYVADQDTDDVFELYLRHAFRPHRSASTPTRTVTRSP